MSIPFWLLFAAALDVMLSLDAFDRGQKWASGFLAGIGLCCAGVGMIGVAFHFTTP